MSQSRIQYGGLSKTGHCENQIRPLGSETGQYPSPSIFITAARLSSLVRRHSGSNSSGGNGSGGKRASIAACSL